MVFFYDILISFGRNTNCVYPFIYDTFIYVGVTGTNALFIFEFVEERGQYLWYLVI